MGIKNHAKKIAATTGIVVAALAFSSVGVASAAPRSVTAQADLDGNGTLDSLSLSRASSTSQVLEATIGGTVVRATVPSDDFTGVQPMQVTDMNADGKAEVVVTEYFGANTVTMSGWDFDGHGLRVLSTVDGEPLGLYEGGGISARSGYACETSRRGKVLVAFSATWDEGWDDEVTYSGTRTSYLVRDGVATPSARFSFTGVEPSSAWVNGNPATCA